MVSSELLQILVCPETRTALREAPPALIAQLNARVASGTLKNRRGDLITEPLTGALVRADSRVAYPLAGNIPILLVEDGIELDR